MTADEETLLKKMMAEKLDIPYNTIGVGKPVGESVDGIKVYKAADVEKAHKEYVEAVNRKMDPPAVATSLIINGLLVQCP